MKRTLIEDRSPLKPSWSLRLAMFLLSYDVPLATAIIIATFILFAIAAPLVWKACQ